MIDSKKVFTFANGNFLPYVSTFAIVERKVRRLEIATTMDMIEGEIS